ncbi:MAG: phosphate regulon sensor histidine kinase PhoR [Legionellales bacterium]|nr:phosphate regulon sensor histidine kinase PhoR [Legionellales bacterium]
MDAKLFANYLPTAIIMVNLDHTIDWFNRAAQTALLLNDSHQHQPIDQVIHDAAFSEYLSANTPISHQKIELDGKLRPPATFLLSIIFLTDQKIIYLDNISSFQKLEKMRKEFVANVSHELRTPLTVIRGYLEGLSHPNVPLSPTLWQDMIGKMQKQAIRMEQIVQDLLLLSRMETNTMQPESSTEIDMPELLHSILQDALALSNQNHHDIKLRIDTRKTIYGSRMELRSAFSNLVFNAVNYTPARGSILLRWYADNEGLHFSVTDTGVGIDPQHLLHLTERFYRAENERTNARGGTGLGLAIVKHVLLRHNAKLHIESTPKVGSTFRCDFPR